MAARVQMKNNQLDIKINKLSVGRDLSFDKDQPADASPIVAHGL